MSLNKTDKDFALNLYRDSNAIIFKIQTHFFLYNVTRFKYRVAVSKKY